MRTLFLLVIAFLLVACGGAGGSKNSPANISADRLSATDVDAARLAAEREYNAVQTAVQKNPENPKKVVKMLQELHRDLYLGDDGQKWQRHVQGASAYNAQILEKISQSEDIAVAVITGSDSSFYEAAAFELYLQYYLQENFSAYAFDVFGLQLDNSDQVFSGGISTATKNVMLSVTGAQAWSDKSRADALSVVPALYDVDVDSKYLGSVTNALAMQMDMGRPVLLVPLGNANKAAHKVYSKLWDLGYTDGQMRLLSIGGASTILNSFNILSDKDANFAVYQDMPDGAAATVASEATADEVALGKLLYLFGRAESERLDEGVQFYLDNLVYPDKIIDPADLLVTVRNMSFIPWGEYELQMSPTPEDLRTPQFETQGGPYTLRWADVDKGSYTVNTELVGIFSRVSTSKLSVTLICDGYVYSNTKDMFDVNIIPEWLQQYVSLLDFIDRFGAKTNFFGIDIDSEERCSVDTL